ncbi:MAG: exodeoxyribonuclease VII large subunit [Eubacteriales bacterium]|nr:exodeoxyribonuclease VII large subunit [Eubacteriales bacterium]
MKQGALTLTVSELNEYVRRSLASDPILHGLCLRGELSNFKRHVSGHWYFTLKDGEGAISCAMFRQSTLNVRFTPRDGDQVTLFGSVGLYAKTGSYQFYADGMEPDGVGELYLRFEALKKRLSQEGLFDASLKKPIPLLPKGVGVVTSKTGAVIHDIARVAWRRNPAMPIFLFPAKVQGEGAADEIAHALGVLDALPEVDVIIVGRGGGSMEDLWAFNEEKVARAIAACRKPVISAVGHETDFTIADFTADLRAPTPSAAAELAVERRDALIDSLNRMESRLAQSANLGLSRRAEALASLSGRLAEHTPEKQCDAIGERVASLARRLTLLCETRLSTKERAANEAAVRVCAAGPEQTLRRGYAIVRQGGRTLQGVGGLKADAQVNVLLRDGSFDARVTEVKEEAAWR